MIVGDVSEFTCELDIGDIHRAEYVDFEVTLDLREMTPAQINFLVTIQPSEFFEYDEIRRVYLEDFAEEKAREVVAEHFRGEIGHFEAQYYSVDGSVTVTPYIGDEF